MAKAATQEHPDHRHKMATLAGALLPVLGLAAAAIYLRAVLAAGTATGWLLVAGISLFALLLLNLSTYWLTRRERRWRQGTVGPAEAGAYAAHPPDEQLLRVRALLEAAVEQSPTGILIVDAPDARVRMMNSAALNFWGNPPSEFFQASLKDEASGWCLHHPDGRSYARDELPIVRAAVAGKRTHNAEAVIHREDGSKINVLISASPVFDAAGALIASVSVLTDITERIAMESRLKQSEAALRQAQTIAQVGNWTLDFNTDEMRWSPEACRIFAIRQEAPPAHAAVHAMIDAADRERVYVAWQAALTGAPYEVEYRISCVSGERWIRERALIKFDAAGQPVSALGTVHDISAQKSMARELERYHEELEQLVEEKAAQLDANQKQIAAIFDYAPILIYLKDMDGRYLMVNRQWEQAMGMTQAQVQGRTLTELFPQTVADRLDFHDEQAANAVQAQYTEETLTCCAGRERDYLTVRTVLPGSMSRGRQLLGISTDISNQKSLQRDLQKVNGRLQETLYALDHSGIAVYWTDLDTGKFLEVNDSASRMLGYERAELLAMSVADIDPNYNPQWFKATVQALRDNEYLRVESTNRHKDGHLIDVEVSAFSSRASDARQQLAYAFLTDISARKQTERILWDAKQRAEEAAAKLARNTRVLRLALSGAGAGYWSYDFATASLQWDEGSFAIFGVAETAFGGTFDDWMNYLHPKDRAATESSFTAALADQQLSNFVLDFRIVQATGAVRYLHVTASVDRDESGQATLCFGLYFDVTERVSRERQIQAASLAAESANAAKSSFLANMSHEIRTPMNAIQGMVQLAMTARPDQQQMHYLQGINGAAASLLVIINDILDFSKIEAGRLDLERVPFRLSEVLDGVVDIAGVGAKDKALELRVQTMSDLPGVFLGDPLRLKQVLVNLVNNAVKFTAVGGVTVEAGLYSRAGDEAQLLFVVRDTGMGMTAEQQQRLFQAFSQADSSTTRKFGGTGLGLAISKRLVEMMDGSITVQSRLHAGSVFHVRVKLTVGDATMLADHAEVARKVDIRQRMEALRGKRVLLVEDNAINQEVASEILNAAGIIVNIAVDGGQALEALADGTAYDGVLMDVQMPVMDGYEATARIRQQPQWRDLPIIAMTANAMRGDREKCLSAGMNDYLSKPVSIKELYNVLVRWLLPPELMRSDTAASEPPAALAPAVVAAVQSLNTASALEKLGGSQEIYRKLLTRYQEAQIEFDAAFAAARRAGDGYAAMRLAHNLKSTSGLIGAETMRAAAARLEELCLAGAPDAELEACLAEVMREFPRVLAEVADVLAATPRPAAVGGAA